MPSFITIFARSTELAKYFVLGCNFFDEISVKFYDESAQKALSRLVTNVAAFFLFLHHFQMHLTDNPTGLPTLEDLGVYPASVQERMPYELELFRAFRYYYYQKFDDIPIIHPLVPLTRLEEKALLENKSTANSVMKALGLTS